MRLRLATCLVALALLLAAAGPLAGQAPPPASGGWQPTMPGTPGGSQYLPSLSSGVWSIRSRDALMDEAAQARFRLGPVSLLPRLYLGNLGYTNNFFGSTTEEQLGSVTVSAGAGLGAIVPVGNRVFLRGGFYPTYTWYSRATDRSAWGGIYDASGNFYLGKIGLELTGGSYTSTVNLSSEVEQPVEQSVLQGRLRMLWEMTSRMGVSGSVTLQRRRYGGDGLVQEDLDILAGLDGTDTTWTVGVQRRVGSRLLVGVTYERGDFAFANEGTLRDAESNGLMGTAVLDQGRLQTNTYLGYRDFRPATGSSFPGWSGLSGGMNVGYQVGRIVSIGVYGTSNLVPSLSDESASFVERRGGAALGFSWRRLYLTGAVEAGQNEYLGEQQLEDGTSIQRRDDVTTWRLSAMLPLYRSFGLRAELGESRYDSNVPGFDRTVSTGSIALNFNFGIGGRELISPTR